MSSPSSFFRSEAELFDRYWLSRAHLCSSEKQASRSNDTSWQFHW